MSVQIIVGDCIERLKAMPDESVHSAITSPPYWGLRDYGVGGQIGLESSLSAHVAKMVEVFREVKRVLRSDGTLWLNYGDAYAGGGRGGNPADSPHRKQATNAGSLVDPTPISATGLKPKDLMMLPNRIAIALQDDGWYVRSEIIWHKPNPMPESCKDRPTSAHEKIWLLSKSPRYYYDQEAIREESLTGDVGSVAGGAQSGDHTAVAHNRVEKRNGKSIRKAHTPRHSQNGWHHTNLHNVPSGEGRNARNVWTIATAGYSEAHFATFPPGLAERCIKAGCPPGGTVLDPFGGAGTTGLVADRLQRNAILIELNPEYAEMARKRIEGDAPLFSEVAA